MAGQSDALGRAARHSRKKLVFLGRGCRRRKFFRKSEIYAQRLGDPVGPILLLSSKMQNFRRRRSVNPARLAGDLQGLPFVG